LDDQRFNSWIDSIFLVEDAFARVATICGCIKKNAGVTAHARDLLQPEIKNKYVGEGDNEKNVF